MSQISQDIMTETLQWQEHNTNIWIPNTHHTHQKKTYRKGQRTRMNDLRAMLFKSFSHLVGLFEYMHTFCTLYTKKQLMVFCIRSCPFYSHFAGAAVCCWPIADEHAIGRTERPFPSLLRSTKRTHASTPTQFHKTLFPLDMFSIRRAAELPSCCCHCPNIWFDFCCVVSCHISKTKTPSICNTQNDLRRWSKFVGTAKTKNKCAAEYTLRWSESSEWWQHSSLWSIFMFVFASYF